MSRDNVIDYRNNHLSVFFSYGGGCVIFLYFVLGDDKILVEKK